MLPAVLLVNVDAEMRQKSDPAPRGRCILFIARDQICKGERIDGIGAPLEIGDLEVRREHGAAVSQMKDLTAAFVQIRGHGLQIQLGRGDLNQGVGPVFEVAPGFTARPMPAGAELLQGLRGYKDAGVFRHRVEDALRRGYGKRHGFGRDVKIPHGAG